MKSVELKHFNKRGPFAKDDTAKITTSVEDWKPTEGATVGLTTESTSAPRIHLGSLREGTVEDCKTLKIVEDSVGSLQNNNKLYQPF